MDESLGKRLRAARDASGITVDDAVYRAKLPRAVVEALEADDFGFFTSPLYARSFLKQYGEYVGVDVSPWIDDLIPTSMIDGEAVESFIDISEPAPLPIIQEKAKSTGGGAMAAVWMILITGGLVWGGVKFFENLDRKLSGEAPPAVTATAEPKPTKNSAPGTGEEEEEEEERPVATTQPEPPRRAIIVREE